MAREIVRWSEHEFEQWKASRPQRLAKVISRNAYSADAAAKRQRIRAARAAQRGDASEYVVAPSEPSETPPAIKRPRGRFMNDTGEQLPLALLIAEQHRPFMTPVGLDLPPDVKIEEREMGWVLGHARTAM